MKKIVFSLSLVAIALLVSGQGCFSLGQQETAKTTGPAGMFVSSNKGENWRSISLLPEASEIANLSDVSVYKLVEDPQDPKAMYWASRSRGLFYTYDEGRTWRQAAAPFNTGFVYSVAVHPKKKCTIFASDGFRVYKSVDCSRSWTEVHREDRSTARISKVVFDPFGNNDVYMIKVNGDLLKSTNEGIGWEVIRRFNMRLSDMQADPFNQGVLYIATLSNGLLRSDDGGATWTSKKDLIARFPGGTGFRGLYLHPSKPDIVFWISTYGILVSHDRGDGWQAYKLITSPGSVDIYGFAVNPNNDNEMYYAATLENRSTFYRSEDGGSTWTTRRMPTGQIPTVLRVHPDNGEIVYAGFSIPPSR